MLSSSDTRFVTFYSYKGGTGRSMALANVAWILASNGRRVLVIDWDLEAPGLHRYFRPFLTDPDLSETDGLIDFVIEFANATLTPADSTLRDDWYVPYADITEHAISLNWRFQGRGTIDFIGAGRQDPLYPRRVNSFSWQTFYEKMGGEKFFRATRQHLIDAKYDYVLIDSRTGVSDTSGICTIEMPDSLVVCFTLNNQGIEGAAQIADSVRQQRGTDDFSIFPVPMRVDPFEKERMDRRLSYARERFAALKKDDAYWGDVEVPYVAYYAYEEILAAFGDQPSRLNTALAAFERLTRHVSGGDVSRLIPPAADAREEVLGAFSKTPLERAEDVAPSQNRWGAAVAAVSFVVIFLALVAAAFRTTSATMSKQARWNAITQLAEQTVARDPLVAALILKELPAEADTAADVARKVLNENLPLAVLTARPAITDLNFSPDGRLILLAHADGTASVWEVETARRVAQLFGHDGPVTHATFDPSGDSIITTGEDRTIRIWSTEGRQLEAIDAASIGRLCGLGSAPDIVSARILASGIIFVQTINRLLLLADSDCISPTKNYAPSTVRVAFSDDGRTLAANWTNGVAEIFDVSGGKLNRLGTSDSMGLNRVVSISRNGLRAVTSSDAGGVLVSSSIYSLISDDRKGFEPSLFSEGKFDPSGNFVVGALFEGIGIYDALTGSLRQLLKVPHGGPLAASPSYSPDGRKIAAAITHELWQVDSPGVRPSEVHSVFIWNVEKPNVDLTATWPELLKLINSRTTACLSPAARVRLFAEPPEVAAARGVCAGVWQ